MARAIALRRVEAVARAAEHRGAREAARFLRLAMLRFPAARGWRRRMAALRLPSDAVLAAEPARREAALRALEDAAALEALLSECAETDADGDAAPVPFAPGLGLSIVGAP